jgi:hypothetical protein
MARVMRQERNRRALSLQPGAKLDQGECIALPMIGCRSSIAAIRLDRPEGGALAGTSFTVRSARSRCASAWRCLTSPLAKRLNRPDT